MTHGSLFSGIGGFDLAAEWMGWENIFHCEWNEFGQKVLKYYWPNAISYGDITKTDFTIHRGKIDILTGGFPCQPYSHAGKRLGKEDYRHLWPEMLRAIQEIKPKYVVGENVAGLLSWNGGLVFNEVQVDLENEGYEVQPVILPACGVNAPHRRDRVWFIAYSSGNGHESGRFGKDKSSKGESKGEQNKRKRIWFNNRGISEQTDATNTNCNGFNGAENGQSDNERNDCNQTRQNTVEQFKGCCGEAIISNPTSTGREEWQSNNRRQDSEENRTGGAIDLNDLASCGILAKIEDGKTSQLNPLFVAEMMGFPPNWLVLPFQSTETNP